MVKSYQAKMQAPSVEPYPLVSDFMLRDFSVIKPTEDVFRAMETLLGDNVSGMVVVDDQRKVVGFLSEKDCIRVVTHEAYHHDVSGGQVADFMTAKPLCLNEKIGLIETAELFIKHPYRKYPVVDEAGKLVGLVRRRDILAVILKHQQSKNTSYQSQL